jgi:hypothetical protein
MTLIQLIVIE